MSSEANKKARRPAGYKPFWETVDEEMEKRVEPTPRFQNLRNMFGKTAAEVATEEAEKLKKKYKK